MQQWFERHRHLVVSLAAALLVFLVLYHAWFYVMGALAVVGAVWVIQHYKN